MRKHITLAALMAAAVTVSALAAGAIYTVISAPEPGAVNATGVDIGKIVAVQIENAVPSTGTFVLSRISDDGAYTNALLPAITATNGAATLDIGTGTNVWIMAGDKLYRSGTITNTCRVRIILAEGP